MRKKIFILLAILFIVQFPGLQARNNETGIKGDVTVPELITEYQADIK